MSTTAILVVTYNRKELLAENIHAMLAQTCRDYDYYVIDNASTDGTEAYVHELIASDPRLHYIRLDQNSGGAGGFYHGMREILTHGNPDCKYTWIMDDDAMPEPESLAEIVTAAEQIGDENFSYLASNVLWIDGSPCPMNECHAVRRRSAGSSDAYTEIDYSSFVGCLVNNAVARQIGLPIPEFFIYMDDAEYTLRLSATRPAYYIPDSRIIHKMPNNASTGIETAPPDKLDRFSYGYRNRVYCYRYRWHFGEIKILILYVLESLRVLRAHPDQTWRRIGIIWRGYLEGQHFQPEIRYVDMKDV